MAATLPFHQLASTAAHTTPIRTYRDLNSSRKNNVEAPATPFYQLASTAAHTTPLRTPRGRTSTRPNHLEVPIRTTNRSSSASSTMSTTSLRGFYEHEEYARIEKVLIERIDSLKRLNNPRYERKLKECESRLEDVQEKLRKAHAKFAAEREEARTPGMGSEDEDEDESYQREKKQDFVNELHVIAPADEKTLRRISHDSAIQITSSNNSDDGKTAA